MPILRFGLPSTRTATHAQNCGLSITSKIIARTTRIHSTQDSNRFHGYSHVRAYARPFSKRASVAAEQQHAWPKPVYSPPQTGVLSILPKAWVPYAELIRLDKPTGTIYLFFPCLFSTLLAAIHDPVISPSQVTAILSLFLSGAFLMRGAGCSINDLWDRNLDPLVQRTALRPLARRAITARAAIIFTGFQLLAGLAVLLQFPPSCLYYSVPSLVLVVAYPLAKRITYYPQFVLGLAFSWGAFMGFPALGISLVEDMVALQATASLYASCVAWTVLYDMIYAHMDIRDDKKAGIKSIALRHDKQTKQVLLGLAVIQIGLLAYTGSIVGAGSAYYLLACGGGSATLLAMIYKVNLKSVADCWWWFRNGAWMTGGAISLGMLYEYLGRRSAVLSVEEVVD